jgi:hypothetical protein
MLLVLCLRIVVAGSLLEDVTRRIDPGDSATGVVRVRRRAVGVHVWVCVPGFLLATRRADR